MTAAARATTAPPILRSAAGEPPLGPGSLAFRDDQGEMFEHDNPRYRSPATRIGVLELENGKWLALPPGFHVDAPQFDSRKAALDAAVDTLVFKARKYMANKEGEGTHWTEGFGNPLIAWALSLRGEKQGPIQATTASAETPIDHPVAENAADGVTDDSNHGRTGSLNPPADTIVRALCEAHRARKTYPAGHSFAMTNPVVAGDVKTVGTCSCGHIFVFPGGDHERMDAAIEAHLQKFDATAPMIDGRGHPIDAGAPAAKPAKPRKTPEPGAGGLLAPAVADAPQSSQPEPAPMSPGAGSHSGLAEFPGWNYHDDFEAIARGEWRAIDPEQVRHYVGTGYVHCTATRLMLTEQGEAFLKQAAPIGAGSDEYPAGILAGDEKVGGSPAAAAPYHAEEAGENVIDSASSVTSRERPAPNSGSLGDGDGGLEPSNGAATSGMDVTARRDWQPNSETPSGVTASPLRPVAGAGTEGAASASASLSSSLLAPVDPAAVEGVRPEMGGHASPALISDDEDLLIEWPSYDGYLEDKIVTAPMRGIEVSRDSLHPWLKPHCKDLTLWALRLGCAAIFANFGLHKTAMQLEWCRQLAKHTGQPTLCVVPLGVRHGFIKEALQLDMDIRFIRTTAELDDLYGEGVRHFLTNYESIREGKLDPNQFAACSLDEASVLRSYGSKTFQEFLPLFAKVEFKLVATATPSPNRYKELIHYAGFLGVMDTGLALTRWFQRNSEKAGDLTLYPHKEDEFWMWVHSWAAFLQKPSELGYSDEGYELPPLKLTWHEVPADHSLAEPERDGQGVMFRAVASSLSEAAKSRRDSLAARIARMSEIIAQDPDSHRILWHDLEAEREAIEQAQPDVVSIMGSMDIDAREERLRAFEEGETRYFATKPILSGSGSNFQYHCHKAIYVALPGYDYKFNDFLQSLYRLQRFGQVHPVEVDIIYSEDERAGRAALEEKWTRDAEMRARMSEIIKKYGLDTLPLRDRLARSIGVKRVEIKGERFIAINNDAVAEARAWPEHSVDQIITSIPFSNHYEYSASYNDFGHTDDNGHFWGQMDFLTAELLRMLKPGRLACIHVKDRVLFGAVTGEGVPTISPFHAEAIMHYRAHGFQYMGMITVVTDVVRENNQTYRLGWSECAKDGTKMGVGSPEYVLLLRKPQSDRSKSYADVPVVKTKTEADLLGGAEGSFSRARWQIDAHALWRSSANRLLTPEEFASFGPADLAKLFAKMSAQRVYDYEAHVKIGEAQEKLGMLPATFMAIAPGSHHPDVWHDVNRMRTLNMLQQRKGAEMHLCPLQFDIVDRLIDRYSNEDDMVYDPFGGLMTVPYRALLKKRRGAATELNAGYFLDGVHYLRMAEEKMTTPQLFDLAAFDQANAPPPSDVMEIEP